MFDKLDKAPNQRFSEAVAAKYTRDVAAGLDYLHAQQVVHRNLKPENLLCEGHTLKIADVGLARVVSRGDMMKTTCGTPGYVAPEILENRGYDSGAVDMWSVGVILYILLCGFPPFYEEELPALFEQILHARYDFPFPWWDEFSQESKDLVRKLLELSPSRRLTAAQVRDGLPALNLAAAPTERVRTLSPGRCCHTRGTVPPGRPRFRRPSSLSRSSTRPGSSREQR